MNTKFCKVFLLALVISGCAVTNPTLTATIAFTSTAEPAQTATVGSTNTPEPTPVPQVIDVNSAPGLKVSLSLQSSQTSPTCSWTKDGQSIWVSSNDQVALLSAAALDQEAQMAFGQNSVALDVSPDGNTVAYSTIGGQEIKFLDIFTNNDVLAFPISYHFSSAFFSPDGSILGVASEDEIKVYEYNVINGSQIGTLSGFSTAAPVYSAKFAQDGKHLIWWSRALAQPMDLATGTLGPEIRHEDFISAISMSHDGSQIATAAGGTINGTFQPIVKLWNASDGSAVWENGNPGYFNSLDFSIDDSVLAAGNDGEVILYDVKTGSEIIHLKTGSARVNTVGFSPDGSTLLTCDLDGNIALWKPQ